MVIKPYFDISTQEVKERFVASLMPFNQKFYALYHKKPDLYGPFWILATLVVILTISGNLSRYLETEDKKDFSYTFHIVPISISLLFGIVIGLPLGLRMFVKFFGDKETTVPVMHGVGIYSYSFSSFLISSSLCGIIAISWIQWILIVYSGLTSCMFLIATYWADLNVTLDARKRLIAVGLIATIQIVLLLVFKLYVFVHLEK